jgi:rare lipoprotein A
VRAHRRARLSDRPSLATWYGPGFFGHETACGQILTLQLAGVANRRLPCGTLIDVSYDGRSIVVPVVDRGPYGVARARWDLTERAAQMLGVTTTVAVHARVVGHAADSPTLGLIESPETEKDVLLSGGASS